MIKATFLVLVFLMCQSSWAIIMGPMVFSGKVYGIDKDRVILITKSNEKISVPLEKVVGGRKKAKYGKWIQYKLFQGELHLVKSVAKKNSQGDDEKLSTFNDY